MGYDLIKKSVIYTKKNKILVIALGALGISVYGAYRIHIKFAEKKKKILKLFTAINSMADAVDIVSLDFDEFKKSNSDEIPNSLKQVSKIAKTDAFSESLMKISRALAVGIFLSYYSQEAIRSPVLKIKKSGFFFDKRFSKSRAVFDLETEMISADVVQESKENCVQISVFEEKISGMRDPMKLGVPQSLRTHVIGEKEDGSRSMISNESEESLKLFQEKVVEIVNVVKTTDHVIHTNTETTERRKSDQNSNTPRTVILKTGFSICLYVLNSPWSFVPD